MKRAAALRPADAPEVAPPAPQPSSDNQALISRYLHARDLRPNSRAAYRADLWSFAAAPGPQSLRDVRADDMRTWLRDHTRAPSHGDPAPEGHSMVAPQPLVAFSPVAALRTSAFAHRDPVRLTRESLRALFDWWERRIAACKASDTRDAQRRDVDSLSDVNGPCRSPRHTQHGARARSGASRVPGRTRWPRFRGWSASTTPAAGRLVDLSVGPSVDLSATGPWIRPGRPL